MKKIILLILIVLLVGCQKESSELTIVTTNFSSYDFVRAITKNSDIKVKMLLHPGVDLHDYEPTPKDIINIQNSLLFIYVGGESDEWVKKLSNDLVNNHTLKLMDYVKTIDEKIKDGMEEVDDLAVDEHIWTSPVNAKILVKKISDEIIKLDEKNKELYEKNTMDYIQKLDKIDQEIRNIVNHSSRKVLIFGDRFPLIYFVNEYHLDYYAAFLGCSHATEASAKSMRFLIQKVKENKIPVVFHIELSNTKIAEEISKETGAKVREFHSLHNISQEDFDKGMTYLDLMQRNIKVLKEALN